MIEPQLTTIYEVDAYDCGGYGDDRSRKFYDEHAALTYAKGLEPRFGAIVTKVITMQPIRTKIFDVQELKT